MTNCRDCSDPVCVRDQGCPVPAKEGDNLSPPLVDLGSGAVGREGGRLRNGKRRSRRLAPLRG